MIYTADDVILEYVAHTCTRLAATKRDVAREIEALMYGIRPL